MLVTPTDLIGETVAGQKLRRNVRGERKMEIIKRGFRSMN